MSKVIIYRDELHKQLDKFLDLVEADSAEYRRRRVPHLQAGRCRRTVRQRGQLPDVVRGRDQVQEDGVSIFLRDGRVVFIREVKFVPMDYTSENKFEVIHDEEKRIRAMDLLQVGDEKYQYHAEKRPMLVIEDLP